MSVQEHFDADQVRLAMQEIGGDQAVVWEVTRETGRNPTGIQFGKLTESARRAWFAMPQKGVLNRLALYRVASAQNLEDGTRSAWATDLYRSPAPTEDRHGLYDLRIVSENHSPLVGSWRLLAVSFSFEGRWLGRLTVSNPRTRCAPNSDSQFLRALVREVGPAVYSKYLVGRLRSQAQAMERARLAQHLHDGIIQTLIGLEMQIDLLRRAQTSSWNPSILLGELHRIQMLLHDEIANIREEMQRVKPLAVEPARLLDCLAERVDRFRREQGISASLVADCGAVSLPPRICTGVARILQEALANVRKHSGARKVIVRFGLENGHYKLCVGDDGCGFGFTGRLSWAELEASSKCPLVIKEIVRAIGGELVIESIEGSGATLEVLVPASVLGREESPREMSVGASW
jgi:signal transduction histidine kinase